MSTSHEISQQLRAAVAFERTALKAEADGEKQYEMKMKSAGASAFAAFKLALADAPEYKGRRIDDAAVRRIYQSTKPRAWWDKHLQSAKQDREWGKRLIQWHLDPDGAKARHVGTRLRVANYRKLQGKPGAQGVRTPQARAGGSAPVTAPATPRTSEMREIARAATTTALAHRELPDNEASLQGVRTADLLNECERIRRAVVNVKPGERAEVLDILRTTAGEVERYVS